MTQGEYRVGIAFNPSNIDEVAEIKQLSADLINRMHKVISSGINSEASRCAAIAQTKYEEAAMWAVKAVTKPPMPTEFIQ